MRARERRKGWSQKRLAAQLGTSQSAIASWEKGRWSPSAERRALLAHLLGIPFEQMLPEVCKTRVTIVRDPQLIALLRLVQGLPRERREALLVLVVSLGGLPPRRSG